MDPVIELLKDLTAKKFTGSVQINFSSGGIANVNCTQHVKVDQVQTVLTIII